MLLGQLLYIHSSFNLTLAVTFFIHGKFAAKIKRDAVIGQYESHHASVIFP